ncbi:uncharacterized protein LOC123556529 [Mercenaria mercenaria]|uniref:uncharacterized protein LOC123556529 n=1 Tax=Mercenaria mercenaria TaxID=6596 RepID=UPI00234F0B28|nr:uncharacterized protein LOC123556529 [Mercenaria mercenaria]XP_053398744.1 uncharacterized protein LOC123556529 [Mercenaria mercenaria]
MSVPGRKVSDFHGSAPDSHGSESQGSSSDFHDSLSHGSTSDSQGSVPHGSVSCGSDEDFNHDCEPCLIDGQHIQAHGYCVECKEYLCRNCFRYHQRTRALKHHQLLDKVNIDNLGMTAKPSKTCTEKCEIHKEEIIKFFCPKHDVLGCTDCMTMNHRVCNIDYIPDKCNDIVNSAEYKDVIRLLDQKIVEADTAVKKANEKDNIIDTCHEKAKQDMDKFQIEIIQLISEKHKQIKAEMDARKSVDKQKIKDLLTSCTQASLNINQLKSNIADSKANNQNGQMFIAIMRAKSHLKSDVDVLKENAESLEKTDVEYTFAHNNELKQMLSKYGKFGQLINSKDTGNVRMPYDSHSKDRDNSKMPQDSHEGNCKMSNSKDTPNSSWARFSTSRGTDNSQKSYDSDSKDTDNSNWALFTHTDSSKKSYDSDSKDTDNSNWALFTHTDSSKKFYDSDSKDTDNSNWALFTHTDSSKKSYDSDSKDTANSSWARSSILEIQTALKSLMTLTPRIQTTPTGLYLHIQTALKSFMTLTPRIQTTPTGLYLHIQTALKSLMTPILRTQATPIGLALQTALKCCMTPILRKQSTPKCLMTQILRQQA